MVARRVSVNNAISTTDVGLVGDLGLGALGLVVALRDCIDRDCKQTGVSIYIHSSNIKLIMVWESR